MHKVIQLQNKGMVRDLSISKSSNEYAYENMNIRITARDGDNLLSVTNEKGTLEMSLIDESNSVLSKLPIGDVTVVCGYCIINNNIILFTKNKILKIVYDSTTNTGQVFTLFSGDLNIEPSHPLKTLGIYENEEIQKVYWTDGINQPRMINITKSYPAGTASSVLDFVPIVGLQEEVSIVRNEIANGLFPPGVIQYSFSYYNKYSHESNIFYTSPLHYTSYENRGASPEDKVSNSFTIKLDKLDVKHFEYIRIYSIVRTSLDSTVEAKRIADLKIPEDGSLIYIDNGTEGTSIDPLELLYIGGEVISANAITQKDNTLFLGNITLKRDEVSDVIREKLTPNETNNYKSQVKFQSLPHDISPTPSGMYPYENKLKEGADDIKIFKYLETYRFGIQFQHETGKWSEPIWVGDTKNDIPLESIYVSSQWASSYPISTGVPSMNIPLSLYSELNRLGYKKVRPVIVYPDLQDRECVCQGILCPTVFNISDRNNNLPFVQSSWFIRANAPYDIELASSSIDIFDRDVDWRTQLRNDNNEVFIEPSVESRRGITTNSNITNGGITSYVVNKGAWVAFRHYESIHPSNTRGAEIQCIWEDSVPYQNTKFLSDKDISDYVSKNSEKFYVDQSIVTMHSPDIEFNEGLQNLDTKGLKLRIIGYVPLTGFKGDIDIQTSTPTPLLGNSTDTSLGFYKEKMFSDNISRFGWRGLTSGIFWIDAYNKGEELFSETSIGYMIYPFHKNGSLNNSKRTEEGYISSMLEYKKLSNLRFSYNTVYLKDNIWYAENNGVGGISGVSIYNSDDNELIKIPSPQDSGLDDITYYGNVDKVITFPKFKRNIGDTKETIAGYPIITSTYTNAATSLNEVYRADVDDIKNVVKGIPVEYSYSSEPIRMTYKSAPHAVMALNYLNGGSVQHILPTVTDGGTEPQSTLRTMNSNVSLLAEGDGTASDYRPPTANDITVSPGAYKLIYDPNTDLFTIRDLTIILTNNSKYDRKVSTIIECTHNEIPELGYEEKDIIIKSGWEHIIAYAPNVSGSEDEIWSTDITGNKYAKNLVLKINLEIDNRKSVDTYISFPNWNYIPKDDGRVNPRPTYGKWVINYMGNDSTINPNYPNGYTFWDNKLHSFKQEVIDLPSLPSGVKRSWDNSIGPEYGFLWLGELYRDNITDLTRFGGTSQEAIENNKWVPCGKAIPISSSSDTEVTWQEGDTYYMRYDHLKTYAPSLELQNGITDIISFMCETRINLDGRYDRNRGQGSNFQMTPKNFNLINKVYSQEDNFFTYRAINYDKYSIDKFSNVVTWSLEKSLGELIDKWTSINMLSTLDLKGVNGKIVSLNTFNNSIFAFQEKGLSNILFNSRVQIPVSDGVPIEITNGYKVEGSRYISEIVGCQNSASIVEGSRGIYFIDDNIGSIYRIGSEGLESISDKLGFSNWIKENLGNREWTIEDFNNFTTFYDNNNRDIYFINSNYCLCYSEVLDQFTSFFSYENVPYMFNVENNFISVRDNRLYLHNRGDYNYFYGTHKPFYVEYRVTPDNYQDKVFSTVEFRADTWDGGELLDEVTFDKLYVENEYQAGESELVFTKNRPSTLKKRFRIWRADIPRDSEHKRVRIRNPWIYLKLAREHQDTYETELHDIIVHYFD